MSLPYENATSGAGAIEEIRKVLNKFGCTRFGVMTDRANGELIVQFTHRDRDVIAKASFRGYAAALLRDRPYGVRTRGTRQAYEAKALKQAEISVNSVLRDWIKGQIMAVETGMLSFDGAFLGQIMLPSGKTVMEAVASSKMLPQLEGPK